MALIFCMLDLVANLKVVVIVLVLLVFCLICRRIYGVNVFAGRNSRLHIFCQLDWVANLKVVVIVLVLLVFDLICCRICGVKFLPAEMASWDLQHEYFARLICWQISKE